MIHSLSNWSTVTIYLPHHDDWRRHHYADQPTESVIGPAHLHAHPYEITAVFTTAAAAADKKPLLNYSIITMTATSGGLFAIRCRSSADRRHMCGPTCRQNPLFSSASSFHYVDSRRKSILSIAHDQRQIHRRHAVGCGQGRTLLSQYTCSRQFAPKRFLTTPHRRLCYCKSNRLFLVSCASDTEESESDQLPYRLSAGKRKWLYVDVKYSMLAVLQA